MAAVWWTGLNGMNGIDLILCHAVRDWREDHPIIQEMNMSDNYTPEQISDMEREASHIAYAVSTAIVNSKFSDQERDLVRQMVTEAAQQLSIKMALILPPKDDRPRFNIRAYIKTSNMGQRELKLGQEETVG